MRGARNVECRHPPPVMLIAASCANKRQPLQRSSSTEVAGSQVAVSGRAATSHHCTRERARALRWFRICASARPVRSPPPSGSSSCSLLASRCARAAVAVMSPASTSAQRSALQELAAELEQVLDAHLPRTGPGARVQAAVARGGSPRRRGASLTAAAAGSVRFSEAVSATQVRVHPVACT